MTSRRPGHEIDRLLLLAFEGTALPPETRSLLGERPVAGFTLFRRANVLDPGQVRSLTGDIQASHRGPEPALIAIDQEGGQLLGLRGGTPFAGNMAIGATDSDELAERVARAIGRELRAVGVNVDYAPVCDLATDPTNPSLGIRSFGEDPARVGRLAAATVTGLQAEGVAATIKHFPGTGAAVTDPHHELPLVDLDARRLESVELTPFRAGVRAGARLAMVGHCDVPALTERPGLPTSLSVRVIDGLLRDGLGHRGVVMTDALDMRALPQDERQAVDAIAAVRAGADLLLCTADRAAQTRIRSALASAVHRELLSDDRLSLASERLTALRRWIGGFAQPDLDVVASTEHRALAAELAERSMTLVRREDGVLPLRPARDQRILAIMPRPTDRTPADTSSEVPAGLAAALRAHHPAVDELLVAQRPDRAEIASARDRARACDAIVVGTIDALAQPEQAALVGALGETGVPMVTVALRTPCDLAAYPEAATHVCAYGVLPPTMTALASALFGSIPFRGRLPVEIAGLYPRGHGIDA
jgi:beta-N-acetylhexosaminidase